MNIKIIAVVVSLIFTLGPGLSAQVRSKNDVEKIIKKIDELYRSRTSYAEIEMKVVTPRWERTLLMKAWSEGMKKTFMRITSPKKEKNVATLRIGNEMWNYLPKANKVIKIPPSMMMSSWMGSDFTNDDLVKESSMIEDYEYNIIDLEEEKKGIIYIELVPKEDKPIVWGKIIIAVRESDYLPVWQKYYNEKSTLMRIMNFREIKSFGGKMIPSEMEIIPQNKKGQKTVVIYRELKFDVELGKEVFSLRNLRAVE